MLDRADSAGRRHGGGETSTPGKSVKGEHENSPAVAACDEFCSGPVCRQLHAGVAHRFARFVLDDHEKALALQFA